MLFRSTSSFDLAEPCVFVKQSPGPFHCGPVIADGAPFIPKLQGQFAEFLSHESLEHLRMFSSTTCVGLRYGQYNHKFREFSWKSA